MSLGGYITVKEAATRFGLTPRRWAQLAQKGEIESKKEGGVWWVTPESCLQYLKDNPRKR